MRFVLLMMIAGWALPVLPSVGPSWAETPPVAPPTGPEPTVSELFDQAETALDAGNPEESIAIYQRIMSRYPKTPVWDQAFSGFESAMDLLVDSHLKAKDLESAAAALEHQRSLTQDSAVQKWITDRLIEILLSKKDHVRTIQNLLMVRKKWVEAEEMKPLEDRVVQIIALSRPEELEEIIRRYPSAFPGDKALLQMAENEQTQGMLFEAERELEAFLTRFPRHPETSLARMRLEAIKEQLMENRFLIGAVLPLSGRLQSFGQEVLNGVRLAVDRFDPEHKLGRAEKFVGLAVRDTQKDPLPEALDQLIREYRVVAVIGPLLSAEMETASARAQRYRIPMISPSATATAFVRSGKYLFRNALTLQAQGQFMAEYAMTRLGFKRFCILYPKDSYGTELMRVFSQEAIRRGGEIIAAEEYDPGATDFGPQIRSLKQMDLGKYGVLGPPPEQKGQIQEYQPGFEAIYLPGDYDQVGLLAAQLAFYDITNVVLLGSNGWHSEELLRIGGKYIDGGLFVDGFFPESPDSAVQEFRSAYRNRFGEDPTLLAAQAYDSAMMVLKALQQERTTGEAVRDYLEGLQNFPGVAGAISAMPEGELKRPLYVIRIQNGKFIQVN